MKFAYFFGWLLWLPYLAVAGHSSQVDVVMRDSGYRLGDYIHEQVMIQLPKHTTLDPESLPLTGYVKPWLDLAQLDFSQQGQTVRLSLTWQIFATVEIAQTLKTPALVLKTKEKPVQTIHVPAQSFYYSPVLPFPLTETKRQNDLPPLKFNTRTPLAGMLLLGALSLGLFIAWLWLKDLLPWPRNPGPMAKLVRSIKRQSPQEIKARYTQEIHQALNASAQQSLFPENLHRLFQQAPYLQAYQTEIEQWFTASWRAMYGHAPMHGHETAMWDKPLSLDWVAQAAYAERLYFKRKTKLLSLAKHLPA